MPHLLASIKENPQHSTKNVQLQQ